MDVHHPHPVLAFYNFHSVPMPSNAVKQLFSFVTSKLPEEPNRFLFSCDVRLTPQDVLDTAETISKCEIEHFSVHRLEGLLSERIHRYASLFGGSHGTIALITGSEEAVEIVKNLREDGLEVVVFHPPESSTNLIEAASKAIELPIHSVSVSLDDDITFKVEDTAKVADLIKEEMATSKKKAELDGWGVPIASMTRTPKPFPPPSNPFGNGFQARNVPPQRPPAPNRMRNPFAPQDSFQRPNPFNKNPFDASGDNFTPHHPSVDNFAPRRPGKPPGNFRAGFVVASGAGEAPMRQPGQQCPLWEDKVHMRKDFDCQLYHPRKVCVFFPNCKLTAAVCFYAHQFCSDGGNCRCDGEKNPQLNHIRS